jgi:hypothetical protein
MCESEHLITYKCEQVHEQMLKMKPQHRKEGNRENVQCVQCTVCIVCTVYSTCKWDIVVRTVVQYVLWGHSASPFSRLDQSKL